MAIEIERKFLVSGSYPESEERYELLQGYLGGEGGATVRVRTDGSRGWITIKGRTEGISRAEFEYEIPLDEATEMLQLSDRSIIEKTRHIHRIGGHVWELDVFHGDNTGLVVTEVELSSEAEAFEKPDWVGDEVSADHRFSNSSLASLPFKAWGDRAALRNSGAKAKS